MAEKCFRPEAKRTIELRWPPKWMMAMRTKMMMMMTIISLLSKLHSSEKEREARKETAQDGISRGHVVDYALIGKESDSSREVAVKGRDTQNEMKLSHPPVW